MMRLSTASSKTVAREAERAMMLTRLKTEDPELS
jgi:hypothetical protein